MTKEDIWKKCVDFHGHECGGLTIGYKAALYAIELLDLKIEENEGLLCISSDEEIVCVAENDACGVDAIQVILGCSVGKGNLLFHMRGKQAFSFYNRHNNKSVRLSLKDKPDNIKREDSMAYFNSLELKDMFNVGEAKIKLPDKARIFESFKCEKCHEMTGSNWIRIYDGKKLCLDCYPSYSRFDV